MDFFPLFAVSLAGLFTGSFLNVLIHRGPAMWNLVDDAGRAGNLVSPPSRCPACGSRIRAIHLVPLLGYALLRGRCADCHATISPRYPLVEIAGALAAGGSFILSGFSPAGIAAFVFFCSLIALAAIDMETGFLPDALTLPLVMTGLVAGFAHLYIPLHDAFAGAIAGYTAFWIIAFVYERWRKIEALGLGDAKLLAALGAWTGWQSLPAIILVASLAGLLYGLLPLLCGKKITLHTSIPFGPALAAGGIAAFIYNAGAA